MEKRYFLNQPMLQKWQDLSIWEKFFNLYPIKTMVELGAGAGGMSLFFALQCYQRGIKFHTFDNQEFVNFDSPLPALLGMKNTFHHVDLFSEQARYQMIHIIEDDPHPLMVFFDNGDKPREWGVFSPLTRVGDFCAVHDWGTEFTSIDLGGISLTPILLKHASPMTRWFLRG